MEGSGMRIFKVIVDRPAGTCHPKHHDLYYPLNYGYIPDLFAGDGEEQDAYILGVDEPLDDFEGELVAVIHRRNDNEDKWVIAPRGRRYSEAEIKEQVYFQEKYFDSWIELIS